MKENNPMAKMSWSAALVALLSGQPALAQDGHHVSGMATDYQPMLLYNRTVAVIIGIGDYPGKDMDLEYARRDAEGMAETLEELYQFDEIITLYDEQATQENILAALGNQLNNLASDDALFVFFAGHGTQRGTGDRQIAALVPFDGSLNWSAGGTKNVSMAELTGVYLSPLLAKHVFLVIDACYAGLISKRGLALTEDIPDTLAHLEAIKDSRIRQILTAGSADQQVLDGGPRGHSVFTGHLLEKLKQTQDYILAEELAGSVKADVIRDASKRGHKQVPEYDRLEGSGGDFVFIAKPLDIDAQREELAAVEQQLEQLKSGNDPRRAELEAQRVDLEKRIANLEELNSERAAAALRREREATRRVEQAELALEIAEKEAQISQEALRQVASARSADELISAALDLESRMQETLKAVEAALSAKLAPLRASRGKYEADEEYQARKAELKRYEADIIPWNRRLAISNFAAELAEIKAAATAVPPEDLTIELGKYHVDSETGAFGIWGQSERRDAVV